MNSKIGKLLEGVWAIGKPSEIKKFIKEVNLLKDKYYNIIGSDDVFDGLDITIREAKILLKSAK